MYMSCLDVQNKCLRVRHARQYVTFTCTYPRCPFILQGKEQETNGESFVSINQFVPHDHQIGGSVPDGVPVSLFRKVYQLRVMCRQDQIELDDVRKKLDNTVGDEHKSLMKKKATIVQRVKNRSIEEVRAGDGECNDQSHSISSPIGYSSHRCNTGAGQQGP